MSDYAINTVFGAKDRVTSIFGKMSSASKRFGDDATRSFRKASTGASSFKKIFGAILASNLVTSGLGAAQSGIAGMATQFLTFDDAITSATSKIDGFDKSTKAGMDALNQLKKVARDVGATTEFSATDAAKGLDFLIAAGFDAKQAMAALPGVVNLATNAKTDLAAATDIAADSLGAFGLITKDNAKLQANLNRVNDVFAKTMNMSSTSLEQLYESAKKGGPVFKSTGQSIESFNAMLGIMAPSSKGEEAGTQLRNVMLRLASPTRQATDLLGKLGVKTKDQKGNFRDVIDIFGDLEKGLKGYGTQQRAAALDTIFGAFAISGASTILDTGVSELRKFREGLYDAGGASQAMADIMRASLMNRIKGIMSALEELGLKFFSAFDKEGGAAIDNFTTWLRKVDVQPLINGVKMAWSVFSGLYSIVKPFTPLIPVLVGAFIAYHSILKAIMIMEAIRHFFLFTRAIQAAVAAQGLLNTVMMLNPIGLVVAAVAALVGVGVLLYKHWDKVTGVFSSLWTWFNKMLDNPFFVGVSALFAPFITIPALIIKHWEPIKTFFGGIFDKLSAISSMASGAVGRFFGGTGGEKQEGDQAKNSMAKGLVAPNKTEIEARQTVGFNGRLDIAGAPAGSTVSGKTKGAPPIRMNLVGVNP